MTHHTFHYRGVFCIAPNSSDATRSAIEAGVNLVMQKQDFKKTQSYNEIDKPVYDYTEEFPRLKTNSDKWVYPVIETEAEPEENELLAEATHEDGVKIKRVKTPKSPLFELLPQVFKGNGKVKRHPFNDRVKTANVRDVIRQASKLALMSSVIVVLPVGTLQLSQEFKELCVNSVGTSTFDLVIEEMIMQGWTIRGVNITPDNSIDIA